MTPPKLVIFDCDGVLVDSEPITNQMLRDDLASRGLDLSLDDILRLFVGGTMRGVAIEATRMGADLPDTWVADFYVRIYAALARGTPLIAGVAAVLDRLDAAKIPYAVGSNGSLEKMSITLGQHPGVHDRLKNSLYSAHALGTAKPEPDMFLIAARDHDVAPADCIVVDDSPTGCTAAQRAGMRCLAYVPHGDSARHRAVGAEPFHDMQQFPALIGLE